jgi:hypothetical protein
MLKYRADREWARQWAPGLMTGVYSIDEMMAAEYEARAQRASPIQQALSPAAAPKIQPGTAEGFSPEHIERELAEFTKASEERPQISDTTVSDSADMTPSRDQEAAASPNVAAETGSAPSVQETEPVSKELLDTYYKAMKRANKKESVQGYVIQFWKANPGVREHLSEDDLRKFATLKGLRIAAIEGTMKSEDADKKAKEIIA